mgnify:FL=1|jgi:hypothetical protein
MNSLEHPYKNLVGGQWLRGNLHAHTTKSDGRRPVQEVIDDYASRPYDFLMISDHDIHMSEADLAQFDSRGMVLIPGNEISAEGPHILHVNADQYRKPDPRRQTVFNEITAAGDGFAVVCHPNWQATFDHTTIHQLREWTGYNGVEIYNGVVGRLNGSPYATNKWDMLLAEGRRLWGYANDDSHGASEDVGLGWNMVFARSKSRPDIVNALSDGRFYCSTGVVIKDIQVEGTHIRVETENAQRIVALHQTGWRFAVADENVIEVDVPDSARYVRFECWGSGEQFAWTQPFFVVPE